MSTHLLFLARSFLPALPQFAKFLSLHPAPRGMPTTLTGKGSFSGSFQRQLRGVSFSCSHSSSFLISSLLWTIISLAITLSENKVICSGRLSQFFYLVLFFAFFPVHRYFLPLFSCKGSDPVPSSCSVNVGSQRLRSIAEIDPFRHRVFFPCRLIFSPFLYFPPVRRSDYSPRHSSRLLEDISVKFTIICPQSLPKARFR